MTERHKEDLPDWINIEAQGLPDFTKYGFHIGCKVEVRFTDGNEERVIYQGYGMFGKNCREDVTHWRPIE